MPKITLNKSHLSRSPLSNIHCRYLKKCRRLWHFRRSSKKHLDRVWVNGKSVK